MYFQELEKPRNKPFLMIFSRNNRFLQRILSADMVYFLSFAKYKKALKFHSLPFGGTVLSPPTCLTQLLCSGDFFYLQ